MRLEVHPNMFGVVERLPGMRTTLARVAGAIAAEAKRLTVSQRIADEIIPDSGFDASGRILARVNAHHWTSWFVEGGTVDQRPSAYLRRAAESNAARRVL